MVVIEIGFRSEFRPHIADIENWRCSKRRIGEASSCGKIVLSGLTAFWHGVAAPVIALTSRRAHRTMFSSRSSGITGGLPGTASGKGRRLRASAATSPLKSNPVDVAIVATGTWYVLYCP